ncbi:hypothetical protein [Streptomyces nitrosporeus]|uniref:hypothetical protein n=1 Tax=Streptomyces nitrosporeus TaxID=28894 RepID=UPI0039A28BAA
MTEMQPTTSAAPEKDTPAAGAEFTPAGGAAVLVGLARALREQPTGRQILDGLDELGELVVCDGDLAEITSWVTALCHLARITVPASAGPTVIYRAATDVLVAGDYTTAAAAQQHCEALVSREYPDTTAVFFEWCVDRADPAGLELDIRVDGVHLSTGYTVTPREIAVAYDPDGDE